MSALRNPAIPIAATHRSWSSNDGPWPTGRNIFLIGRRPGDEDQLTQTLAFVWQEYLELLDAWLEHLGLALDGSVDVDTQFILPSR